MENTETSTSRLRLVDVAIRLRNTSKELRLDQISLPEDYLPDAEDVSFRDPQLHADQFHTLGQKPARKGMRIAALFRRKNELTRVAVKRFDVLALNQKTNNGYSLMLSELQNLMYLVHPNIVAMVDSFFVESSNREIHFICVATERMDCTLAFYFDSLRIKSKGLVKLRDHRHLAGMLVQLFRALDFLHLRGIIHRNITPRSIGMNRRGFEIKLLAFECSGQTNSTEDNTRIAPTPPAFQPLEMILQTSYDRKVDVWAAGLVALYMLDCKLMYPTELRKQDAVKQRVLDVVGLPENRYKDIFCNSLMLDAIRPSTLDKELETAFERLENDRGFLTKAELKDLLKKIFTVNPLSRPRAIECLQHPYLSPMNEHYKPFPSWENDFEKKNERDKILLENRLRTFSRQF